jgi:D-psicose/D-tagatose/L-ribulose 3-epimerase
MNPVGIHFGYWTQMWSDDPLQFLPKAQQCGFDILEINAPKVARMSDAERATLKAAADEAGLKLTYSIGMTADLDVSSEDAATRKKGTAFLQDLSRAMKQLDGAIMAGINYGAWPGKLLPGVGDEREVLVHPLVFRRHPLHRPS